MTNPYQTPESSISQQKRKIIISQEVKMGTRVAMIACIINIFIPIFIGVYIVLLAVNTVFMVAFAVGYFRLNRALAITSIIYFCVEYVVLLFNGSPGNYLFFCLAMLAFNIYGCTSVFKFCKEQSE
ncbi:hypothetical protein [Aurantivibrio infirmus]